MTIQPKTCQICAEDCSDRPRVKDSRGRYYCRACAQSAASSSNLHELPQDFFDNPPDEPNDDPDAEALDIEPDRPASRGVCPSCFRPLPPDTGVCATCSTANKRGAGSGAPTCQKCGYDLTGATSLI